jgi:hypothetical protein
VSPVSIVPAAVAVPFWQSATGGILIGGGVTLVTTIAVQQFSEWRTARREARAAASRAEALRVAFQVETVTQLQEELETVSAFIGNALSAGRIDRLRYRPTDFLPSQISFGRVGMLCSRLDDPALKTRIRDWLRGVREMASTVPEPTVNDAVMLRIRKERVEIIDELGALLQRYHGQLPASPDQAPVSESHR